MKYIITVDTQSRNKPTENRKEIVIETQELRKKGNVHDDLIIENNQAKVIRRIGKTQYDVTYVLNEEVVEELGEVKIPLFEGDNYIYIKDEYNNNLCAEYIIKNDFTDRYVTNMQLSSAIEQTAEKISLTVDKKLEGYSDTEEMQSAIDIKAEEITSSVSSEYATKGELITAKSEIKQTTDSISSIVSKKVGDDEIISMINQSPEEIKIKSGKIALEGHVTANGNFKIDTNGNMACINATVSGKVTTTSGKIAGFEVNNNILKGEQVGICGKDGEEWAFWAGSETGADAPFKIGHNGEMYACNANISGGKIIIQKNYTEGGIILENLNKTKYLAMGYDGINLIDNNDVDGQIALLSQEGNYVICVGQVSIWKNRIVTPTLIQTSLKAKKKNIKQFNESALDLIKNSNICLYNLKEEKDESKQHLGLIIGEGYNCPTEIISENGQGIEQYSMTSLAWKAIQELIEENKRLNERLEIIEEEE